jgi:hypothetical protein
LLQDLDSDLSKEPNLFESGLGCGARLSGQVKNDLPLKAGPNLRGRSSVAT